MTKINEQNKINYKQITWVTIAALLLVYIISIHLRIYYRCAGNYCNLNWWGISLSVIVAGISVWYMIDTILMGDKN